MYRYRRCRDSFDREINLSKYIVWRVSFPAFKLRPFIDLPDVASIALEPLADEPAALLVDAHDSPALLEPRDDSDVAE